VLREIAPRFKGDIVNVSGWRDEDKEGGCYRDYFPLAASYSLTNYRGTREKEDGLEDAVYLDLQKPLPEEIRNKYDVVFSHTVLEHIADVTLAFECLCSLTRDAVIVVAPFLQQEHYAPEIYGDYWRFTPLGLKYLFDKNGLSLVYLTANDNPWYPIYLLAVGARAPESWSHIFPEYDWDSRLAHSNFLSA